MAATVRHSLPDEAWVMAFSGPGWAFIQLSGGDPVSVYIGQSAPPAETMDRVVLERGGLEAVSLTSLAAGDSVYLASFNGDPTSAVVVSGT